MDQHCELMDFLPKDYQYHVCRYKAVSQPGTDHIGFEATVRMSLQSKEAILVWLKSMAVTWRVAYTRPTKGQKIIFKADYRCQHNTKPREKTPKAGRVSKNTDCPAKLKVTLVRTEVYRGQRSRSTDPHIPDYPTLVDISNIHNHNIHVADAVRHQDVGSKAVEKLTKLFDTGRSPSSTLDMLKYDLQVQCEDDYIYTPADRAICPDLQFCYRMPFHFCTQCGTKLQPNFRFCPSCGEKLPCPEDASEPAASVSVNDSPSKSNGAAAVVASEDTESLTCTSVVISTRPPLRKTRSSRRQVQVEDSPSGGTPPPLPSLAKAATSKDHCVGSDASPLRPRRVSFQFKGEEQPALESSSPVLGSPRQVKGRAKGLKRDCEGKQAVDGKNQTDETDPKEEELATPLPTSHVSSPAPRSPFKVNAKVKKTKRVSALMPLQGGEEVVDTAGRKWKLGKLQSQSPTELVYEVSSPSFKGSQHILKLGAKDGRIFNEQNFLQRAAKSSSVQKWIKSNKMDVLGLPSCTGFGLHADEYRFLIFPNMGQTLQSIMEEREQLLTEKTVLHLACRTLDVLEYIHSNEYVHGNIEAENIYIQPGEKPQIFLVGYCHAFRYCPGGSHVEYREASRTPHDGTVEFLSLDSHRGAGPSRRSDLQSLGFCLLRWLTGPLPWTALTDPDEVTAEKQRYMKDVPAFLRHCSGKKRVPSPLQVYLTKVMSLDYSEQPDYAALREAFRTELMQQGGSLEKPLDL
ncbi:inactive serine/threonine-protein kinase VRK3 [Lampris incognitus]|uniref:inactive serine/threonine-protein kinase VRK3 n=1 Tax=Lampris incognitus TaxID=2546036 RepID=UPI0024B5C71D|nr:inactive serine/threonine-protein kinase VRK3 [Lampris incognitus]